MKHKRNRAGLARPELLLVLLVLFGCESDLECESDGDCPAGQECIEYRGFFSNEIYESECADTCESHEECAPGEACVSAIGALNNELYSQCLPGCRSDDDCSDGAVCGLGSECSGPACTDHSECAAGERCEGGFCEPGCRPSDCSADEYCGRPYSVAPFTCLEVTRIRCGDLTCESIAGFDTRIEPCCVPGKASACGYVPAQVWGGTNAGGSECIQPIGGTPDASCPFSQFGAPCRDAAGQCGGLYAPDLCGPRYDP